MIQNKLWRLDYQTLEHNHYTFIHGELPFANHVWQSDEVEPRVSFPKNNGAKIQFSPNRIFPFFHAQTQGFTTSNICAAHLFDEILFVFTWTCSSSTSTSTIIAAIISLNNPTKNIGQTIITNIFYALNFNQTINSYAIEMLGLTICQQNQYFDLTSNVAKIKQTLAFISIGKLDFQYGAAAQLHSLWHNISSINRFNVGGFCPDPRSCSIHCAQQMALDRFVHCIVVIFAHSALNIWCN